MKKLFLLVFAIILLLLFVSCNKSPVDIPASSKPETTEAPPVEQVYIRVLIDDDTRDQILITGKNALTSKYPDLKDLFPYFQIYINQHAVHEDKFNIDFYFYLHGYNTPEKYNVTVTKTTENTFEVDTVEGFLYGEYSQFVPLCTKKQIKEAENKIISKHGNKGSFYLQVTEKGDLVITAEYILKTKSIKSLLGLEADHKNVFISETICEKPSNT